MDNPGRRWFEQPKTMSFQVREVGKTDTPDLWTKCPSCSEVLFNEVLAQHHQVCPHCDHHFRCDAMDRVSLLVDEGSLVWHDAHLAPVDRLGFVDSKPYADRIEQTRAQTGRNDAFLSATAAITGVEVEIGTFEFKYMGGSMGSVVGELVTRLFERGLLHRRPTIVISASGGARMQEGVLSLMQMAKTCAALKKLQDAGLPYVSIITHPTTGGVAASFAMLGDLILAEPQALIGFAGPRVIRETIGQDLPDGFQTSEYLLSHGMVDAIVSREKMRPTLARCLRQFLGLPALDAEPVEVVNRAVAAGGAGLVKPQ